MDSEEYESHLKMFHLACLTTAAVSLGALGPGRGKWMVEPAEQHGISSAALDAAAARIKVEANERCKSD